MNRQCADCHRWEPSHPTQPAISASGGFYALSSTIYDLAEQSKWYCDECRAKYPAPEEYGTECDECDGGLVEIPFECSDAGCDHRHVGTVECGWCDGTGQVTTHDCNPGCDHSFSLPELRVERGGIQFARPE